MKRRVFRLLFLSLLSFSIAHAQDDLGDDEFFEDEEAIVDPADEFMPPGNPNDNSRPPRPGVFPRASGGLGAGAGSEPAAGGLGATPEGAIVFRLVDPPQFRKPRTPTRIPYAIRKKVEERLKEQSSQE